MQFIGGAETALWSGVTVDATAVKYSYAGDANLDGVIDGADYGVIDGADYGLIDNSVQFQGEPL